MLIKGQEGCPKGGSMNYAENSVSVKWCWIKPQRYNIGWSRKNSFITLPGKGACGGLMPQKLCPSLRGLGEVFYSNGSKSELLIRIWVCAGTKLFFFFSLMWPRWSPPLSLHLLPFLISNCLHLPFVTQGRPWKQVSICYKQETEDIERILCPRTLQSPIEFQNS